MGRNLIYKISFYIILSSSILCGLTVTEKMKEEYLKNNPQAIKDLSGQFENVEQVNNIDQASIPSKTSAQSGNSSSSSSGEKFLLTCLAASSFGLLAFEAATEMS